MSAMVESQPFGYNWPVGNAKKPLVGRASRPAAPQEIDMRVHGIGHVVLKVRDLSRSVPFYKDVLGLKEVAQFPERRMVFFVFGDNHHDIALAETSATAPDAPKESPGLAHVALKVGDSLDELREAQAWLAKHDVAIDHKADHTVSQSIYFHDPDGNQIEFFVDNVERPWRRDPQLVASSEPLTL
jgi:catechol-2,3-dioxygenase